MIKSKHLHLINIAVVTVSIIMFTAIVHADSNGSIVNPAELPTSQAPEPLEVKWKERGGHIVIDSVCFNYDESMSENKGCRRLAHQKFEQECDRFRRLYHDSRPYYDQDYFKQMEKYCQAASEFHP